MNRREALVTAATLAPLLPFGLSAPAIAQGAQVDRAPSAAPTPSAPAPASAPSARVDVVDELKALLQKQAKQWSAGDIEGFCAHYGDDCLFLSPGGLTRGRKEVLDRYKKKYVDKAAMGTLTLEVLGSSTTDALASIAMAWTLAYPDRASATGFSLIALEKRGARWKIVHDASM